MQEVMFKPESDWRPTEVSDLPSWKGAKRIGLDIETCDPQLNELGPGVRRDGRIIGISFAIEDGPAHYLPFDHEGGDNLDAEHCFYYIFDNLCNFNGSIVGANLQYDIDYLLQWGMSFNQDITFKDIEVAEPLLDEHQFSYSLDNIAARYDMSGKSEDLLIEAALAYGINPKAEMWQLPARYVGEYAIQDARLPLALLRRQERRIDEEDLWDVFNLECALTPVLVDMTRRGVRIDEPRLAWIEEWALREEKAALKAIKEHTGRSLALGESTTTSVLAGILRQEGLPVPKTVPKKPTSMPQDSVTNDYLKTLKLPWTEAAVRARSFDKLRTTFVASIKRYMCDGRIHTGYNQLRRTKDDGAAGGTISGRLSSCDPNIQQQPSRDEEIAPIWRSIYVPEPGCLWRTADYSEQEPRLTVHYSEKHDFPGAHEFGDRYRNDPSTSFHSTTAKLAGIERKSAKALGLGKVYGMSDARFCRTLSLPTAEKKKGKYKYIGAGEEGQAIIDAFEAGVPFISRLISAVKVSVAGDKRRGLQGKGYLVTLLGSRRRFNKDQKGKYLFLHKCLNCLIQTSAAYQMKKGMVDVYAAGLRPSLQVHDQLDDGADDDDPDGKLLKEILENAVELTVPSKVDLEIGPNWGEVK